MGTIVLGGYGAKPQTNRNEWVLKYVPCASAKERFISQSNIIDMALEFRGDGITALKRKEFVLLSSEAVSRYVTPSQLSKLQAALNQDSRKRIYLVRAVSANPRNRMISASFCDGGLRIFSGSLGGASVQKDPVIMLLDQEPKVVSITFADAK